MNNQVPTPLLESVSCRFAFDRDGVDAVFREWLTADSAAAQLSRAFRAYYQLRGLIPLPLRQLLQRLRRVESSRRWCYPDAFAESLAAQLKCCADGLATIHPWPDGADFAFVLTHDVETADGMRNIMRIADLEQELDFRSSWNIVPHKYPVDRGLLRELADRGFEIGVHGYNHDGKLFSSRAIFDRRVPAINEALRAFGAVGFRAPMVHRNLAWLQALDIEYDASYFDADPYQAMPGGVGAVWPFIAGRFVELPYTLPQDHTLMISLQERDGRTWQSKLDYLQRMGGMSLVITHPDYLNSPDRIDIYRGFLKLARESVRMWHALPREVALWWRERDQSTLRQEANEFWSIHGPAVGRARPAALRANPSVGPNSCHIEWSPLPTMDNAGKSLQEISA